jgi:hypothetical protein
MEVELLRACVSCGDEKSLGKKTEAAAIMLMQSTESTTFQSAQEYREALGALSRFMAIRRRRNDLVSAGPRYGMKTRTVAAETVRIYPHRLSRASPALCVFVYYCRT